MFSVNLGVPEYCGIILPTRGRDGTSRRLGLDSLLLNFCRRGKLLADAVAVVLRGRVICDVVARIVNIVSVVDRIK